MQDYDYIQKILLIGDSGVGKSSIVLRFTENTYNESYISTIGVDFKVKKLIIDNNVVKIQLWDTAGQERFKTITFSYYRGSHAVIIVFDITSRESFMNIEAWLEEIYKFCDKKKIKIIIIGNKKDLENTRKVSYDEAFTFANNLGFQYYKY